MSTCHAEAKWKIGIKIGFTLWRPNLEQWFSMLGFTLELLGELFKILCLRYTSKYSDLIVLGALLGIFEAPSVIPVCSQSWESLTQMKLKIPDHPRKFNFRVFLNTIMQCSFEQGWTRGSALSTICNYMGCHLCYCSGNPNGNSAVEFRSLEKELSRQLWKEQDRDNWSQSPKKRLAS